MPTRRCSSRSVIHTIITLHSHFQLLYSSRQKRPTLLIKMAIIKIEALCFFCLLNILQTLPQIPDFKAPLRVPISWLICKAIACVITQCRRWAVLIWLHSDGSHHCHALISSPSALQSHRNQVQPALHWGLTAPLTAHPSPALGGPPLHVALAVDGGRGLGKQSVFCLQEQMRMDFNYF